ncbi:MAG: hypothetical protein M3Y36_01945 [Actinomycetota bacterium]|nr:hypothetical protein [Actinomycetota bacterium]
MLATLAAREAWGEGGVTVFFVALGVAAYRRQPRDWRGWIVFCSLFTVFCLALTVLSAMGHVFYGL